MMAGAVESFNVHLDNKDYQGDVYTMLQKVKPSWRKESIIYKEVTTGFVNTVVHIRDTVDVGDAGVVLRIFGRSYYESTLRKIRNAEREKKSALMLSSLDLGPKVEFVFDNGYCYEYVQGVTFAFDTTSHSEERVIDAITAELAKWHSPQTAEVAMEWGFEDTKFQTMQYKILLESLPSVNDFKTEADKKIFLEDIPPLEVLQAEAGRIQEMMEGFDSPMVFCHNDLNITNMVYKPNEDRTIFIDIEVVGLGYPAYDIMVHVEHSHVGTAADPTNKGPSNDYITMWIRKYLEKRKNRGDIDDFTAEDVQKLFTQAKKLQPVLHFSLGIHILRMATLPIKEANTKYDYLRIAAARLKFYFDNKVPCTGSPGVL